MTTKLVSSSYLNNIIPEYREKMICSTLSGMIAVKHPTLGVLVREDGMVFQRKPGLRSYIWSKGYKDKSGYLVIGIRGKQHKVHRLVAEAFIPNPDNKPTVDHINRIRDDNRVTNLRWATHKEQAENSGQVLNRVDYGVRKCENPREYHREYVRNYRKANRDEIRAHDREYRKAHRDEINARKREYRKAHRDEINARKREYYQKHKDEAQKT